MNKSKYIVISSLVAVAVSGFFASDTEAYKSLYLKNNGYGLQTSNQKVYKTKQADFVMLGDSITFNVQWNELLGMDNVVNRGIGGDYTEGMINRLDLVTKLKPEKVFVMAGINDLLWGSLNAEKVFANYKTILTTITKAGATPTITSTLYVGSDVNGRHKGINGKIEQLNKYLREYAKDNGITFIDLNKSLAPQKVLLSKYTVDGVHLNGNGYEIWGKAIYDQI